MALRTIRGYIYVQTRHAVALKGALRRTVIVAGGRKVMSRQRGFSLIELLIAVVIILIVAAIAIPNLMRSRLAANESSAVATLHAMNTSEIVYSSTYGKGYSADLTSLGGLCSITKAPTSAAACLLDGVLANDPATKSGYVFTYNSSGDDFVGTYTLTGGPVSAGATGQRHFFTDQTGVIRYDASVSATASSNPI
jgi:type IV pilus assembly protein PilA